MSARTIYVKCPAKGCDEIRNAAGITMHIRRSHPAPVTASTTNGGN